MQHQRRARRHRPLRIFLALTVFTTSVAFVFATNTPEAQAGPPPVLFAYVPLPTDDYQTALNTVNSAAGSTMQERIGITIAAAGSIMYYDHWEDGYESDIANPTQSSSEIWGDGNTANGDAGDYCASGCAGDVFTDGAVLFFEDTIPTPRTTAVFFDGSDKVAATRGFTVTKAGWGNSGPVHAGSVAAFDTSRFGTFFEVPVGEDSVGGAQSNNPFNYTGVSVMASRPNTFVQIDVDGNGSYDQSQTLAEGETMFLDGGLSQGARIAASQPVQAHLLTGDRTASYEDRWFELFPVAVWDNSYFAAAVTATGSNSGDRTELWVYNNKASSIDVDVRAQSGVIATLPVPAKGVARYSPSSWHRRRIVVHCHLLRTGSDRHGGTFEFRGSRLGIHPRADVRSDPFCGGRLGARELGFAPERELLGCLGCINFGDDRLRRLRRRWHLR